MSCSRPSLLALAALSSFCYAAPLAAAPKATDAHTAPPTASATPTPAPGKEPVPGSPADPTPQLEPPAGDRLPWLRSQLDALLADASLSGVRVGVAVAEAETGKLLYGRNETALFNPASNVKLFTTAAALALL